MKKFAYDDVLAINNIIYTEKNQNNESFNSEQLKIIRNIRHYYAYTTITAKNMNNGCMRVVIDSREFNGNTAQLKINDILGNIDEIIGLNYKIKYEKPLQQVPINYPNYTLYRLVLSIEPVIQELKDNEITYNDKTGYWELNGNEYVSYEDALEYL